MRCLGWAGDSVTGTGEDVTFAFGVHSKHPKLGLSTFLSILLQRDLFGHLL